MGTTGPTLQEQRLLDAVNAAGFKYGDEVVAANFGTSIDCSYGRASGVASQLKQKGLWPYKAPLRGGHRPSKPEILTAIRIETRTIEDEIIPDLTDEVVNRKHSELSRKTALKRTPCARRGQGQPATGERLYSAEELEYMRSVEEYKHRTGRKFPTVCEYLAIARKLGYAKQEKLQLSAC